ncbi:MAG: hypothetical protein JHC95_21175 [Solirubrobacteraceae bacterium]|nr:hypothetical protein [Solirubrobacteraceae bacterium]
MRGLAGLILSCACLLALPASAHALSCAPEPAVGYFAAADVVVVGQVLDGPRTEWGALASPVGLQVTRYEKGAGPAVIRFTTTMSGTSGGIIAGGLQPSPGQWYRLYGTLSADVLDTNPCLGARLIAGPDAAPLPLPVGPRVEAGGRSVRPIATLSPRSGVPVLDVPRGRIVIHSDFVPGVEAPGLKRSFKPARLDARGTKWRVSLADIPRGRATLITVRAGTGPFGLLVRRTR